MENSIEILEKIYNLSAQSQLSDERLEMQFSQMNKRIETLERLSETMAENLNELKHLQTVIDRVSIATQQNTSDIQDLKAKYYELEQKPLREKANKWQYIIDYIFKGFVGAVLGVSFFKLGFGGEK